MFIVLLFVSKLVIRSMNWNILLVMRACLRLSRIQVTILGRRVVLFIHQKMFVNSVEVVSIKLSAHCMHVYVNSYCLYIYVNFVLDTIHIFTQGITKRRSHTYTPQRKRKKTSKIIAKKGVFWLTRFLFGNFYFACLCIL